MTELTSLEWVATHPLAKVPERQKPGDVGLDLALMRDELIPAGSLAFKIDFGVILSDKSVPKVSAMILTMRSSLAKTGLRMSNSVGIIEPSYSGHEEGQSWRFGICMLVDNATRQDVLLLHGHRVAQLLIYDKQGRLAFPFHHTLTDVCHTHDKWQRLYKERRGGFGSTGA